ncbi:MAG TPA: folylpolyglutamate synthase/dihydrofolate synthase family protein [Anaerolineaceae bacterium]|nr:folylpolyglutamate synthase/dihydrofolate synthase family protein [Anaerolineaceae bacterium]
MKKIIETYDQALDFIYSKVDFSYTKQQRYSEEVFNLDRMLSFMKPLGDPQNTFRAVHVAGTKGKGSISAMIASALQTAGYRTGFYSSPHMIDYTERIQIDSKPIPKEDFVRIINRMYPLIQKTPGLTTFEITTAVAFEYFKDMQIEFGVIEVGLGGRLDATNIINPEVSIIASISLDHTGILGNTVEAIAAEKAGIIKHGIPVVISDQIPSVYDVFHKITQEKSAPFINVREVLDYRDRKSDLSHQTFTVHFPERITNGSREKNGMLDITIPLLGKHQMENAGAAFCALKVLQEKGYKISDRSIQSGFCNVSWPGRFEILRKEPYLIIDAAHNLDSSHRLVETIQELFPAKKITLIFGASEDKDIAGMLDNFSKVARLVILTQSTHPRAAKPDVLQKSMRAAPCDTIMIEDVQRALEYALEHAQKDDVILVSGSVFIAAAIREIWFSRHTEITV